MAVSVADRLDIQDLVSLYAIHIDLRETDAWAALFEKDGVLDEQPVGAGLFSGQDEIRAYGERLAADNYHVVHFMVNHVVHDVTGDEATGTVFAFVEANTRSNGHTRHYIMYRDSYARADGKWRFRKRIISPLFPTKIIAEP